MKPELQVNDADVKRVTQWIESIGVDKRQLWNTMEPVIREQMNREFSDENPNRWKALSPHYLQEKLAAGFPATIGVRTGNLKRAATDAAIVEKREEFMVYTINPGMDKSDEGPYFEDFHAKRKIFRHTTPYINKVYHEAAERWIKTDIDKGAV
jgi:hypothetical protein